jgi:hypothetical protein
MSRRLFVVAALVVGVMSSFAVREARAQDRLPIQEARVSFMPTDATAIALQPRATSELVPAPAESVTPNFDVNRTKKLLPLYASVAVMQALDVHSTIQVLSRGGGEGNPMLQGIVSNRPLFIATKSAIAASTIYAASRIAKRSKVGAIVTLVGLNSVYAMVVSHNYKLAHELR